MLSETQRNLDQTDLPETSRDQWLVTAYLLDEAFANDIRERVDKHRDFVWGFRDMIGFERSGHRRPSFALSLQQREFIVGVFGSAFQYVGHPEGGWSGSHNPWDAADFVTAQIGAISADPSAAATAALERLVQRPALLSYRDYIKHYLSNQRTRRREAEYQQPNWSQTVTALANEAPANVADLHAVLVDHMCDLSDQITNSNTDVFKRFWNEDSRGWPTTPKPEESCRDVLVDLLRERLGAFAVNVEPEGHMARDKRADIAVSLFQKKVLVEIKRDYHRDLWTAIEGQLEQYTRDPNASGFGVYTVFWFGAKRPSPIPGGSSKSPRDAADLEAMLHKRHSANRRDQIAILVIDVS